jgi:predicted acyltransferase
MMATMDLVATRLRSVDVFRGVTMATMVIVNNPGDWNNVYSPLLHAPWHGWTPTDLVFPFFLFIVGVAITLSPKNSGTTAGVLRRGLLIFGLGLFLTGFPFFTLATWRIPGVLQRIAVCYVAAVAIMRLTAPRHDGRPFDSHAASLAQDRAAHMRRLAVIIVAIVLGYAALMLWTPVPGGRAGDLSAEGNLGAWLDRALMSGHLWRRDWDPEGLLSTLPAIASTLMGVMAGQARQTASSLGQWRRRLVLAGAVCLTLGAAWDPWFPINKSLWTSSYVLFTGGVAAILLAICSMWSDGGEDRRSWRMRTSEPFVALGRNAILLFVLSGLAARLMGVVLVDHAAGVSVKEWVYATLFAPVADPRNASLLFAGANLVVLYALLTWLHRRRLYWKV